MKYKDALNDIANEAGPRQDEQMVKNVLRLIENDAKDGHKSMYMYSGYMNDYVVQRLRNEGISVVVPWTGGDYFISWKQYPNKFIQFISLYSPYIIVFTIFLFIIFMLVL